MLGPCPVETQIARLVAARAWLGKRGYTIKVDLEMTPPVPRYQLTGEHRWLTADRLIARATAMGWQG